MKPMLVSSGPVRPDSDKYAFEVKWDGFRALIEASPDGIQIWSRNGHDMTSRYPELLGMVDAVSERLLLDGEIVCLDDNAKPDFAAPLVPQPRVNGASRVLHGLRHPAVRRP